MKRTTEQGSADTMLRAELHLQLAPAGWVLSTLHHFFPPLPSGEFLGREAGMAEAGLSLRGRNTDREKQQGLWHALITQ